MTAPHNPHDDGSLGEALAAAGGTGELVWSTNQPYPTVGKPDPPEEQVYEGTQPAQQGGRFGRWWRPQPYQNLATGEPGARTFQPSPGTRTGVVMEHAGRTESRPEPGPTREIEGNVPPAALRPGMGADPPHIMHIVHHVTHNVEEGNAWWATLRLTVPTGNAILIAPANPRRSRLLIVNTDTANTVDLGVSPDVGAGTAATFPLSPGASVEHRHVREIYAIANTAPIVVAIKSEFSEREGEAVAQEQRLPWANGNGKATS